MGPVTEHGSLSVCLVAHCNINSSRNTFQRELGARKMVLAPSE